MKFFIISDVHGFYDEMIDALNEAGFDKNNKEHWLISCGDNLDRGPKPQEVIDFMLSLSNKTLIKGNHESLFEELCDRRYPMDYDRSNGTAASILSLAPKAKNWESACLLATDKMQPLLNQMVNYFETKNYIFVHSWIPLECEDNLPKYYTRNRKFKYNPNWRNAHASEWDDATWGNPFDNASNGLNQTGKIIVHGHWSNSRYWAKIEDRSQYGEDAKFNVCEHDGCIGLDATTALSGKVNVLVLEDEFLDEEDVMCNIN